MPISYNPLPTDVNLEALAQKTIAASPVVAPATKPEDSLMGSKAPPRQLWVGTVSAIVAGIILKLLTTYTGIDFAVVSAALGLEPGIVQTTLAGVIGLAIAYFVPPAKSEVVQHMTDEVVKIAMADPKSNVSYFQIPVKPPADEPAVIVPPAAVKVKDAA